LATELPSFHLGTNFILRACLTTVD
jgi:hypothetical protein